MFCLVLKKTQKQEMNNIFDVSLAKKTPTHCACAGALLFLFREKFLEGNFWEENCRSIGRRKGYVQDLGRGPQLAHSRAWSIVCDQKINSKNENVLLAINLMPCSCTVSCTVVTVGIFFASFSQESTEILIKICKMCSKRCRAIG